MSITLKAWEQAKSAETNSNNYPDFPEGKKIETLVTELSCKFQDDDPEKPNFMLKFQTNDDRAIRSAKYYACYDRSGISKTTGKSWSAEGRIDTINMVKDIKTMGYDLEQGDDVSIEDVMKAISQDQPIVLVDCVVKGKYRNYYLNSFVRYANDSDTVDNSVAEETTEETAEEPANDFIPNAGMLVLAKPGKCKKTEEYKVIISGEESCTLRRIRDKEVYEDVPFDRVYSEVE
jgi:hypothetical protein